MNLFIELHRDLIKKLLAGNVDFIIIGGYSVIFHGYERTTGDIDIWLKPDNANKEKLLLILKEFGIEDDDIAQVAQLDFSKHQFFNIGEYPEKIDFLTYINIVQYNDADKHKVIGEIDGLNIPFLNLNHLVLSKINTGRPQDKADIEKLQSIEKTKDRK